jgi:hypothetical protein
VTYDPALRTPQADVEEKLGVVPVEELLAERDELVKAIAPLWALYGPGGTWEAKRKILLATLAQKYRALALVDGKKVTEAAIDDQAHADDDYAAFVQRATEERDALKRLDDRVTGIGETIRRGDAICRYQTAEAGLTPR